MKAMKFEGTFQIDSKGRLIPFDIPTEESCKSLIKNQLVECEVRNGEREPATLEQFGMYFACCAVVAHNTDNRDWDTKEKVDFQCRIGVGWAEAPIHVKDSTTIIVQPKSLKHKDMDKFIFHNHMFEALIIMADFLGVTPDRIADMARENMKGPKRKH